MNLFKRLFGTKKEIIPVAGSNLSQQVSQSIQAPVDWSNSEIHLMLLCEFLKPKYIDYIAPEQWKAALGEFPRTILNRFIKDGLLVPLSLKATVEDCNTVADLKKLLKERGLKGSGKKQELVERLVDADEVGMSKIYGAAKTKIECSPEIRPRVLQYVADKEQEFNNAAAEALAALRERNFARASRTIRSYESNQLRLPTRGLRVATVYLGTDVIDDIPAVCYDKPTPIGDPDADITTLEEIFTLRPKILSALAESEWEPLWAVVALSHLLHGRLSLEWLPAGFAGLPKFGSNITVRMMQLHIRYLDDLKRWRRIGIKQGKIISYGDPCCDECAKISNKIVALDTLPELPYEKCTCADGCDCSIRPIMDLSTLD